MTNQHPLVAYATQLANLLTKVCYVVVLIHNKKEIEIMTKRKVVDARKDESGKIEAVLLEGNVNYTSVERAYDMATDGKVDLVPVKTETGNHVRTRPDKSEENNLSQMADD